MAYDFLRRFENRLQMLRDQQTHRLPTDPLDRARVALAMGYAGLGSCAAALDAWREQVHAHFRSLLGDAQDAAAEQPLWPDRLDQPNAPAELAALGLQRPGAGTRAPDCAARRARLSRRVRHRPPAPCRTVARPAARRRSARPTRN